LRRVESEGRRRELATPERLYLREPEWREQLASGIVIALAEPRSQLAVPRFAEAGHPTEALGQFVEERLAARERLVLAGATAADPRFLGGAVERQLDIRPERFMDWDAAVAAPPASVGTLLAEPDGGFV
jgi:hypothetical protein